METKGEIYKVMSKIVGDIGAVEKAVRNQAQGYSAHGIDGIYNAIKGVLSDNGVFFVPKVLSKEREERTNKHGTTLIYTVLTVQFTFFAGDGSSVEAVSVGEAMDAGDKSCNKAMSSAVKYALIPIFCISTGDKVDTEEESHEVAQKRSRRDLVLEAAKAKAWGQSEIKELLHVECDGKKVDEIDPQTFAEMLTFLERNTYAGWKGSNKKGGGDFEPPPPLRAA